MRPAAPRVFLVISILLGAVSSVPAADEIDRLLAAVNGRVVTASDLRLARNLNTLIVFGAQGNAPLEQELARLIDLEILRQELESSPAVAAEPARVEARLQDLRNAYAEIGGLNGFLRRLGLEESELRAYVALQVSVDNFVSSRFRPFVSPSEEECRAYYRDVLMPRLAASPGTRVPPFEEVSAGIARILTEQGVLSALERWLTDVRQHLRIEMFTAPAGPGGGGE
jgi:hypothetical protein